MQRHADIKDLRKLEKQEAGHTFASCFFLCGDLYQWHQRLPKYISSN